MTDKIFKPKITVFYNTKCLKCGTVKEQMQRIGAIVMCNKCKNIEFGKGINLEIYRKWLEIYKEI